MSDSCDNLNIFIYLTSFVAGLNKNIPKVLEKTDLCLKFK